MTSLRGLTSLGCGGLQHAPVGADLEGKVKQDKAHNEDLEGGPALVRNEGVLSVPLLGHGELLVHVLGKLEVKESDFIASEMARKLDLNGPASINNRPLGMMILLSTDASDTLNEILSLSHRVKAVGALKVSQVGSL